MSDDEGEEIELQEGMSVENEDGASLGTLAALLVEEDEEDAEFMLIADAGTERLIPFEAVVGVGDGKLILDVPKDVLDKFPRIRQGMDPTEAEMELAYKVFDEHATYE